MHVTYIPEFKIDCTLQGCYRSFYNYHTFRNHIYAFHSTSNGELNFDADRAVLIDDEVLSDSEPQHLPEVEILPVNTIKRASAIWTLKVRDGYGLPQSTTESIIKDVNSLYQVANYYQCSLT